MITVKQCCCGYPNCSYYWLVGVGSFNQGSGFSKAEAENIANLLNAQAGNASPAATYKPTHGGRTE